MAQKKTPAKKKTTSAASIGFNGGKTVNTDAEFKSFLNWLEHSGFAEERKRCYIQFGIDNGQNLDQKLEEMGSDRFLNEAKAGLIFKTSGSYLTSLLKEANNDAKEAFSSDIGLAEATQIKRKVSSAKSLLAAFYNTCAREIFKSQITSASMNDHAADELISLLEDRWIKDPLGSIIFGAQHAQKTAGSNLVEAFKSFIEAPERRAKLLSKDKSESAHAMTASEEAKLGEFAPLIRFLNESLLPSERAEMMAKMLAYVESGWAELDLISGQDRASIAKDSPWSPHENLQSWRKIAQNIKDREHVDTREVLDAFAARFGEIAALAKINGGEDKPHLESFDVLGNPKLTYSKMVALAPAKATDVCIISPKAQRVELYCATSDALMLEQRTQAMRYLLAIENAIANGDLNLNGFIVPPQALAFMTVLAPCLVQTKNDTPYKQAGHSLLSQLQTYPNAAIEQRLVNLINAIPMIETIAESHEIGADITRVKSILCGSNASVWKLISETLTELSLEKNSKSLHEKTLVQFAEITSEMMNIFNDHGICADNPAVAFTKNTSQAAKERPIAAVFNIMQQLFNRAAEDKENDAGPQSGSVKTLKKFCTSFLAFQNKLKSSPGQRNEAMMKINFIDSWIETAEIANLKKKKPANKTKSAAKNK